jgi:hypothetical protein
MGYPRPFPRRPRRFTCAALGAISQAEARYLNAKVAAADGAIRAAARAAGADYVHALHAFEGGELRCFARPARARASGGAGDGGARGARGAGPGSPLTRHR